MFGDYKELHTSTLKPLYYLYSGFNCLILLLLMVAMT